MRLLATAGGVNNDVNCMNVSECKTHACEVIFKLTNTILNNNTPWTMVSPSQSSHHGHLHLLSGVSGHMRLHNGIRGIPVGSYVLCDFNL